MLVRIMNYQLTNHDKHRWYSISVQQDMFNILLIRSWGGLGKKASKTVTEVHFSNLSAIIDAHKHLKRKQRDGYKIEEKTLQSLIPQSPTSPTSTTADARLMLELCEA
jgi:predicted DNA-binding WGR domain protein